MTVTILQNEQIKNILQMINTLSKIVRWLKVYKFRKCSTCKNTMAIKKKFTTIITPVNAHFGRSVIVLS